MSFSESYIGTVRGDKSRKVADEIARAIAKVCGKPEDLLVFQKYYDAVPQAFRDMIENLRSTIVLVLITLTNSGGNAQRIEIIKNKLEKLPIAELITEASNTSIEALHMTTGAISQTDMLNANHDGYPVNDDAMFPLIPKGATVYTWAFEDWTEYNDGDMLCYHKLGDEAFYIREVQFLNDEHTEFRLLPRNNSYPKDTCTKEDILLYGKVTGMFVDFFNDGQ